MKRRWVLVGIILLVAAVLFEEKHRAATHNSQAPVAGVTQSEQGVLDLPPSNFSDQVNLWGNPRVSYADVDLGYTGLALQTNFAPANFEQFRSQLDFKTEPVLTVMDREVAYAFFASGGFSLTLKLKPEYANPEALIPTRVNPGIGVNFKF